MTNENGDRFQKLYESLSSKVLQLESELSNMRNVLAVMEAEKKQWQAEKFLQQGIIQQAVNKANEVSNQVLEENKQLREEIKRLRG